MDSLLDDVPRGRYAGHIGKPPDSHFELPSNLAATESLRFKLGNPESKMFLGVVNGNVAKGERLPDGRATRYVMGGTPIGIGGDQHGITIGGSRTGKGRNFVVPNLLALPAETSLVSIDPKGDNARLTAPYRADVLGQAIAVFDSFGVAGDECQSFHSVYNPIETVEKSDNRTFVPNAKLIADALIVTGDFKDKHWDTTAQQILSGLCALVAHHERYAGHRNLLTVYHLASELTSPDPDNRSRYWLEKEMLASDIGSGFVKNAARGFYDKTTGEFSSVLSNLRKHIEWIGIECMADSLVGKSIDLKKLKSGSMAVYISLPTMRMSDLSGWLRLIIQMALAAHEEEQQRNSFHQTVFLMDEFHVLGRLSCLETAAAQIAGLGAKLWPIIQDLGQLKKYESSWETFLGNAGIIQMFGLSDQTTLKYASEQMGQALALSRSTNLPTYEQAAKNAATGESWSITSQPLMTPEEISRFFARDDKLLRQLIIRPGYHPAIIQRAFYDKHQLFRGMCNEA